VRNVCDTCNQVSELLQMPGRSDMNCSECHAVVVAFKNLSDSYEQIRQIGGDTEPFASEIDRLVRRLECRVRLRTSEANSSTGVQ